jgi:hypothetical protein
MQLPVLYILVLWQHVDFIHYLLRQRQLSEIALVKDHGRSWCNDITGTYIWRALHATYPTLPTYARLIELIIPSFLSQVLVM